AAGLAAGEGAAGGGEGRVLDQDRTAPADGGTRPAVVEVDVPEGEAAVARRKGSAGDAGGAVAEGRVRDPGVRAVRQVERAAGVVRVRAVEGGAGDRQAVGRGGVDRAARVRRPSAGERAALHGGGAAGGGDVAAGRVRDVVLEGAVRQAQGAVLRVDRATERLRRVPGERAGDQRGLRAVADGDGAAQGVVRPR